MIQIKKLMITLVALLAVTTQAWAQGAFMAKAMRQSTNNCFSDVIRMHSHISKGGNYKCVLSDEIVHLIVVAHDLGAIGIFAFNRFRMSTIREFHQRSNALLNFKFKVISYAFAKFINEILAYTLKLSICTFRNDYSMQHNQLCAFSVCWWLHPRELLHHVRTLLRLP